MYGLVNSLKTLPGKGRELADILVEAAHVVGKLDGCMAYLVSFDTEDSDRIWVTEFWDSKETHDNSLQLPEVQQLIKRAMPHLDSRGEKGTELTLHGGYGF